MADLPAIRHNTFFDTLSPRMKMKSLRRTCREVSELVIAREDRPLALPDQVALRLHLLVCKTCPSFENQVLTVRAAMGAWRQGASDANPPPK